MTKKNMKRLETAVIIILLVTLASTIGVFGICHKLNLMQKVICECDTSIKNGTIDIDEYIEITNNREKIKAFCNMKGYNNGYSYNVMSIMCYTKGEARSSSEEFAFKEYYEWTRV